MLNQIFVAFLKIFDNLSLSSIYSHLRLDTHHHINFRVNTDVYFILLFYYFCSCKNDLSSYFIRSLLVGNRSWDTPVLIAFLKQISNVDKISRCNNEYFIVRKINDLCIIIWRLYFFIVLVDVSIKWFLKL